MEILVLFFKGMLVGFLIAAPIGPAGALCVHRTLNKGRFSGLVTGFGAASVDMIYGGIAAFGFTFISNVLFDTKDWTRPISGIFLLAMGAYIYFSKRKKQDITPTVTSTLGDFSSVFFINLANPLTIVGFAALFSGLGIASHDYGVILALWLILGIVLGSLLCWTIFTEAIYFFRKKMSQNILVWVNRSSGLLVIIFGILVLLASFYDYS